MGCIANQQNAAGQLGDGNNLLSLCGIEGCEPEDMAYDFIDITCLIQSIIETSRIKVA
jgi:hypothetical protein